MRRRALPAFHVACRARGIAVALSRLSRCVDAALLKRAGGALLATSAGCVLACAPGLARADTYTVTKLADTNDGVCDTDCSLREAVAAANAHAGADTVNASTVTGTITLAEVPGFNFMEVTDALTVIGPGADLLTVDADTDGAGYGESRFFSVTNPNAEFTIEGLTLVNGNTVGFGGAIYSSADLTLDGVTIQDARSATKGGGISVANADVTLTNSTISGCFADTDGGGLYVDQGSVTLNHSAIIGNSVYGSGAGFMVVYGNATLIHSTVRGNTRGGGFVVVLGDATLTHSIVQSNSGPTGGGFQVQGNATVSHSTIRGNASSSDGGGFYVGASGNSATPTLTLTNSTVSGNFAGSRGGGFFVSFADATLTNSTVSANLSNGSGGGFRVFSGNATLSHSTVSGNVAGSQGGGFRVVGNGTSTGVVEVNNSILANNVASKGFSDEFRVSGAGSSITAHCSLVAGTSEPAVPVGNGNILGIDPGLGPLQDNGGPTFTHALLPGSPAINTGDPAFASPPGPAYDQRGAPFVRVFGGRLDMGSVERQVVPDVIFADGFD